MGLIKGRGIGIQSFSYILRDSDKNPSGKGTEPNGTQFLRALKHLYKTGRR